MHRSTRVRAFVLSLACCGQTLRAQVVELEALHASDAAYSQLFGINVSVWGDRALVGSRTGGPGTGAAYVFERQATGDWKQVAMLLAADAELGADVGYDVALEGDRALVGAPDKLNPSFHGVGAAYVFERAAGGAWSQVAKLTSTSTGLLVGDFGDTVSLSGDRAIVGDSSNPAMGDWTGAAHVFERDASGSWAEVAVLHAGGAASYAFGIDVAIEGEQALVGSYTLGGGGYVFERQSVGTWLQTAQLIPPAGGTYSVDIEGDLALLGSTTATAHVFARQSDGTWVISSALVASGATSESLFGFSVALQNKRALIGAPYDQEAGIAAGAAYVFERGSSGTWPQVAKLLSPGGGPGDQLGRSVALSGDRVLAGATFDATPAVDAGSASLFDLAPLGGDVGSISVAQGGTLTFELDAGHLHAGEIYHLLGSFSGTTPGSVLGGLLLPLNFDRYFRKTYTQPGTPPLAFSFGVLGLGGSAIVHPTFSLVAGADPAFVGLTFHHAFVTADPVTAAYTYVSNALAVKILP